MSAKILVVDDSATDRLIIKNMLSEYSILTACDGLEAIRLINAQADIDLIILDVNMPNMDGFEVLRILKSDNRYKQMRTIILTNYDELENEIRGLKLGAVDYIRKPIHMDALKIRIEIHLELLRIQKLLEQNLYENTLTFDTIFQQAPIGIAISHSKKPFDSGYDDIISLNPVFERITGRTKEEITELGWEQITHPDDLEADMKLFEKLLAGEITHYSMEKRYIRPDGDIIWAHIVVSNLRVISGYERTHICLAQDITQRKAMEEALMESERSKSVLLSHLPGMAYRCNYDREWTMQYVSAGCADLTGYAPESLLYNCDLAYNDLITPEYREPLWKEWKRILAIKRPFKYEYEIMTANGQRKWVLEMGQGIYNAAGDVEALEGIILDISDRKAIENNLRYNSEHDLCTGLYNRIYLEWLLERDARKRPAIKRAVVGINLNAVHLLSMTYGFHYSQDLIKRVADALGTLCDARHQLFSTFENQLVIYIENYEGRFELLKFCQAVIETSEAVLAVESIGAGIGVVEIDESNRHDIEQLLKNLLVASEKALNSVDGDISFCFFDNEMEAQILREEKIKRALARVTESKANNELFLQFQPIWDIRSDKICGFEALARLNNSSLGLVQPMEFIPIAEKIKLIAQVGERIIWLALQFLNTLKAHGYGDISVAINISATQLLRKDFVPHLLEMIQDMQVDSQNVCLEITESIFASNYQEINNILSRLKRFGIRIAIDDFGTGYSSLARVRELNVNCLKIDKYFIDKLLTLSDEEAITGDIISMAHKLGHYVIAEGIEQDRQIQYLKNFGCDQIQGYLIAKPLEERAALELLEKQGQDTLNCAALY